MKKWTLSLLVLVMMAGVLTGCGKKNETMSEVVIKSAQELADEAAQADITIVYTNDVHSYIDNAEIMILIMV